MQRVLKDFSHDRIIINTHYIYGSDTLIIVFKNIHTGKKTIREYKKPRVPIYILNEKTDKYLEFAPKKSLTGHMVSYKWREYDIAKLLGINNFKYMLDKKLIEKRDIHIDKRLFGSDINIEDLVMKEFFKFCLTRDKDNNVMIDFPKIDRFHIGGLDIETDINVSDERKEQPIIANTAIDNKTWKVVTTCLINDQYNGQKEVMENIDGFREDFKKTLYDHIENINIDEDDPGKKAKIEKQMKELIHSMADQLSLDITFTNDEREVIRKPTEFLMKEANPDFCYIYNAQYDISQMEMRANELKMDFNECFRYKPNKPAYTNFIYNSKDPDPKKREHYYNSYNPTKIVDQLLQYAQLRRSKLFASYTLESVAKREIGVAKLDYSKITSYIGDFPYVDYKNFLIYNIIDVFIMLVLDRVTNDCYSQVYSRFNLCTEWGRIAKPMKRTVNVFDTLADVQGYIAGNEINGIFVNMNKTKMKKIEKSDPNLYNVIMQLMAANVDDKKDNPYRIPGGCVAEATKIRSGTAKNVIYDFEVKRFRKLKNCADLDALAMYPNNIIANNGSKTTLLGILCELNGVNDDNIAQRGALSLINNNFTSVGHNFFGLPGAEDLIREYHDVKPVYKKRVEEINGYNVEDLEFDPKNRFFEAYRKLLGKLYNTKFDDKDIEAGAPPLSKYFLSNDSDYIRLSYYDTLVELKLVGEGTFNELCDFKGKGFICGQIMMKDRIIKDRHEDYLAHLAPTTSNDIKFGNTIGSGIIQKEDEEAIESSIVKPFDIRLNGIKFNAMKRLLFWDKQTSVTPLSYELLEVINNQGQVSDIGALLKLHCEYQINKENKLRVTQSIMLFRG